MSETDAQRDIRAALGEKARHARLMRNNRGAFKDATGRLVRFGVGDPGGSDLIGWTSIVVTPDMVGQTVAIFTAGETKKPGGKTSKQRLQDQTDFLNAVRAAGGRADFIRSVHEALHLVRPKW